MFQGAWLAWAWVNIAASFNLPPPSPRELQDLDLGQQGEKVATRVPRRAPTVPCSDVLNPPLSISLVKAQDVLQGKLRQGMRTWRHQTSPSAGC